MLSGAHPSLPAPRILYDQLGDTSCDNPNGILLSTIEETGINKGQTIKVNVLIRNEYIINLKMNY